MKEEIINAEIESAQIGFEGHGILTIMFTFKTDGGGQGYGGYRVDGVSDFFSESIKGILNTLEVENWEDVKGAFVRIKRGSEWNGKITAFGNIVKNKWFSFEDIFERQNL